MNTWLIAYIVMGALWGSFAICENIRIHGWSIPWWRHSACWLMSAVGWPLSMVILWWNWEKFYGPKAKG